MDILLLTPGIPSSAKLILSPLFWRQWPSVHTAIENGGQKLAWLEAHLVRYIPRRGGKDRALPRQPVQERLTPERTAGICPVCHALSGLESIPGE